MEAKSSANREKHHGGGLEKKNWGNLAYFKKKL
jgi:hypothetical protein